MNDEVLMRRTFELARKGAGSVSPNPLVGAVLVSDGGIVGEGWHQRWGGPHAEVNAISNVADTRRLENSVLYVNLEPCSHYGKTPPCADLVISSRIRKVVISTVDPNPLVAGRGIQRLRDAGVEVVTGVLETEGRELNKRFFTFMERRVPYVILKWAETADGFIARENGDSKWISNEYSRLLVHRWRSEEDAIMIGRATAAHDNPMLNVRDWTGRNPVRIVLDRSLSLPDSLNVFDGSVATLRYNTIRNESRPNVELVRIDDADFIPGVLDDLYRRRIQSVIVEGGTQLLTAFIRQGLWNEARIFKSPKVFGTGKAAPQLPGRLAGRELVGDDELSLFFAR